MKLKTKLKTLSILTGLVGIGIIIYSSGFLTALGIFLFMWSNNLSRDI